MTPDVALSLQTRAHLRTLTLLSLLSRILVATLIVSSSHWLTLFDSSPQLVLDDSVPPWIASLLRWDAFHFAHVAQEGHVDEHSWAFFPALPLLMRWSGNLLSRTGLSPPGMASSLLGGALLAAMFDPTQVLYRLSLHHLRSPSVAFLAAALSLLPSSPATLRFAPYSEPFFTYCSYRGMWSCARTRWVSAAAWFALASAFRSNGILLSGFILWGILVAPRNNALSPEKVAYAVVLAALPVVPFAYHNYTGYAAFCTGVTRAGWCTRMVPLIYSHVQEVYWNVGFMRYWTVSNVPNFVLALPALANVYAFGVFYLVQVGRRVRPQSLFLAPGLLPHVLHALAMALLLTFNAHVQIALRVLPSMPVVYWAAARLVVERPGWGRAWIVWSVMWGAASCVLWAVFLPPA